MTKNELFNEITTHLMNDAVPSEYIAELSGLPEFGDFPLIMLKQLKSTKQPPKHHPEGSVWNHTLMVVDEAAKRKGLSEDSEAFMWAALLHDIGKPPTTKIRNGKLTSYGHDEAGAKLAVKFLSVLGAEEGFIKKVAVLVRWHMQILFVLKELPFADEKAMKAEVGIHEIALLGLCDRLGRMNADVNKERENIRLFVEKCAIMP